MNRIKNELNSLKQRDIYSLILFALYKFKDVPEYSSISELAYVLDKDNLLKLCEYFGGTTLKIPTIDEVEYMLFSLLLYEYVNIEHMPYDDAIKLIGCESHQLRRVRADYEKLLVILDKYSFVSR